MVGDRDVSVGRVEPALGNLSGPKSGEQTHQSFRDELLVQTGNGFVDHGTISQLTK